MFDARSYPLLAGGGPLVAERGELVPYERLLVGQTPEKAAETVPRLFGLSRAAQRAAARIALGLDSCQQHRAAIRKEILRDHLTRFHVIWPAHFSCAPQRLPAGWMDGGRSVAEAIFGAPREMPATPEDFEDFLAGPTWVASILRRIDGCFERGEAATGVLPSLTSVSAFAPDAVENSLAGRHALHPVMRHVDETRGRGPLWRAVGRAYDICAALGDRIAVPYSPSPGKALVPATRGTYAMDARTEDGHVRSFLRISPTDHLLAPNGILDVSLAHLRADKAGLAPLLIDILDPCTPVRVRRADG